MRVTRLEIFGFKSFVERFVLNFDKNMIGIVGPNGCGKSNVVDALRWVLGETHAKQLRGGSFEDLLFNGSEKRRPLGMAEVSLTIQPEKDWEEKAKAHADLSGALSKLDRLEEAVNASVESLSEEENPNAESQSDDENTESEITASSEDSTQEKLSVISKKVMEIPGLFDVAEIQFTRRLYRSGESEYFINKVPCRLRDMQDVYRLIGLGARGLSIVQQGQIGQLISKKPLERRELLEEAAGISGFRTKMETAGRRLEKTNDNLARITDIIQEVEKQVRNLKRQAQRARVRQDLKNELYASEKELFELKSSRLVCRIEDRKNSVEDFELKLGEFEGSTTEHDARVQELEAHLHDAETSILALRREKDVHSRALMEQEARLQSIRIKLVSLEGDEQHLSSRLSEGEKRREEIQNEISSLESEHEQTREMTLEIEAKIKLQKEKIQELSRSNAERLAQFVEESKLSLSEGGEEGSGAQVIQQKIQDASSKIEESEALLVGSDNLHREASDLARELKSAERSGSEAEKRLTGVESEIKAIEKQLKTFATHALEAAKGDTETGDGSEKVLLSLIQVSEENERALHAVLGERAEYLVSKNSAQLLSDFHKNSNIASVKKRIGVLDASRSSTEVSSNRVNFSGEGVSELASILDVESEFRSLVDSLLQDTFVADNLEAAHALATSFRENNQSSYTIVLRSGEVLTPWGWYSTQGEGVHFSFTRRLKELTLLRETLEVEHRDAESLIAKFDASLQEVRSKIDTMNTTRSLMHSLQKELSELFRQQGEEEKRRSEEIRTKERALRDELLVTENQEALSLKGLEQEGMRIESNAKGLVQQLERLKREEGHLLESEEENISRLEEIRQEIEKTKESAEAAINASSSDEVFEQKDKIQSLELEIEESENQRVVYQKELGEIRFELSEIRRKRESIERDLRGKQSELDRAQIELELLLEDIKKYYPEDESFVIPEIEQAKTLLGTLESESEQDRKAKELSEVSGSIRKRLEREGEVDPQAIELYEQEEARLESMTTQVKDLSKAKETLERTIRQLKELSRVRFVETFKAVNDKFKELIPRLFAGGSGHLELLNPEDPLQSGVTIVVKPPGKKITTMELMSGGEKALVATAVLVAVFLHHPGPICVLDEVDAPLDDANLGRFLDLIKEISDRTQFLIITHNKITMHAVDRLIGITMQESGVTTAISVDLEEAEEEIEKWVANA